MVKLEQINLKHLKELYDYLSFYNMNCIKLRTYHMNKFDLITVIRNTDLIDETDKIHLLVYDRTKWIKFIIPDRKKNTYDRGLKIKVIEFENKKVKLDFT